MKQSSYHAKNAIAEIRRDIESLLKQFNSCRDTYREIKVVTKRIELLDRANEDFKEMVHDKRQSLKTNAVTISFVGAVIIDCIIGAQAGEMLAHEAHLPAAVKYLIPAALIVLEFTVAYLQILRQRENKRISWVLQSAPYLVICIVAVFATMNVMYAWDTYTSETEQMSFGLYMLMHLAIQGVLFIAAALLHYAVIKHSEMLSEVFAFLSYKRTRQRYVGKRTSMRGAAAGSYLPAFTQNVCRFTATVEQYKSLYPDYPVDFSKMMPAALINAINAIMGRAIFSHHPDNENERTK